MRQIAAVVLKKKIGSHWQKLDADSQGVVQTTMLGCLQAEGERAVRKSVVVVVAAVAKQSFQAGAAGARRSEIHARAHTPTH